MHIERLEVKLTEQELKERSAALAEKVRELEGAEAHRKSVSAELKEAVEELEHDVSELAGIVRRQAETRPVECAERGDHTRAVMDLIRLDTGEVVRSRPMTADELAEARQVHLFDANASEQAPKGKRGKKVQAQAEAEPA